MSKKKNDKKSKEAVQMKKLTPKEQAELKGGHKCCDPFASLRKLK